MHVSNCIRSGIQLIVLHLGRYIFRVNKDRFQIGYYVSNDSSHPVQGIIALLEYDLEHPLSMKRAKIKLV